MSAALDGAMHSVWLHGDWRWLTQQMTTEEREAAADAVERHWAVVQDPPPIVTSDALRHLRWWRAPQPAGSVAERLAAALGWPTVPEVSEETRAEMRAKMAQAEADARRIYGEGEKR